MDMLASYASSDEDEEHVSNSASMSNLLPPPKSSLFTSLPPPKSNPKSSLFTSLPPPKSNPNPISQSQIERQSLNTPNPESSSLFSSIPLPKSTSSASAKSRKVVQFRPPTIPTLSSSIIDEDEDADDKDKNERQKETMMSGSSGLVLPAPRHSTSLGTLGSGRKSMFETVAPVASATESNVGHSDYIENPSSEKSYGESLDGVSNPYYGGGYVTSQVEYEEGVDVNPGDVSSVNYNDHDGYSGGGGVNVGYEVYQDVEYTNAGGSYNPQYENTWADQSALSEASDVIAGLKMPSKRGRKDALPEIVEVKQDELIKNRPREDQRRSTGIAFGPQYQPTSTKGKPSKLHKRKHQIGSLYFEMKQNETKLIERRSQGYQTKAQTQAKYGW